MPTYRVGPGTVTAEKPSKVIRPLICEQCLQALGNVQAVAEYARASAATAVAIWPEMRRQIEEHEQKCQATRP